MTLNTKLAGGVVSLICFSGRKPCDPAPAELYLFWLWLYLLLILLVISGSR